MSTSSEQDGQEQAAWVRLLDMLIESAADLPGAEVPTPAGPVTVHTTDQVIAWFLEERDMATGRPARRTPVPTEMRLLRAAASTANAYLSSLKDAGMGGTDIDIVLGKIALALAAHEHRPAAGEEKR